jgi:hypothetical protein
MPLEKIEMKNAVRSSTGTVHNATVAHCCDQPYFAVFQVEGQHHIHIQCGDCGTSYCPAGECEDAGVHEPSH